MPCSGSSLGPRPVRSRRPGGGSPGSITPTCRAATRRRPEPQPGGWPRSTAPTSSSVRARCAAAPRGPRPGAPGGHRPRSPPGRSPPDSTRRTSSIRATPRPPEPTAVERIRPASPRSARERPTPVRAGHRIRTDRSSGRGFGVSDLRRDRASSRRWRPRCRSASSTVTRSARSPASSRPMSTGWPRRSAATRSCWPPLVSCARISTGGGSSVAAGRSGRRRGRRPTDPTGAPRRKTTIAPGALGGDRVGSSGREELFLPSFRVHRACRPIAHGCSVRSLGSSGR